MKSSELILILAFLGIGGVAVWFVIRNKKQAAAEKCELQVSIPGVGGIGGSCLGFQSLPQLAEDAAAAGENIVVRAAKLGSGYTVVKGAVAGVKGWFTGNDTNCSAAQQPENAMWCRQKFGYGSAPGSDAWAIAHGQKILYTGPGST